VGYLQLEWVLRVKAVRTEFSGKVSVVAQRQKIVAGRLSAVRAGYRFKTRSATKTGKEAIKKASPDQRSNEAIEFKLLLQLHATATQQNQ